MSKIILSKIESKNAVNQIMLQKNLIIISKCIQIVNYCILTQAEIGHSK